MTAVIRTRGPRGAVALAVGLLTLTGCATLGLETPATAPQPLPTIDRPKPKPKEPTRGDGSTLTDAQAQAALLTETDLGAPWAATRGAATWRDGLLKATTEAGDCQPLLDALYTDELLGGPSRVAVGLDDADTDAQLRYQIGARRPADVDTTLDWLRTMPAKCARFTATTELGLTEDVQVTDAPLPEVGDVRQGLRVTLAAVSTEGEDEAFLTLDVAAVRVGEDAFALTNGGLGDVPNDATQAAVQIGALRLADVRRQGRAQV
ncbi:hypothetical protein OIB37_19665 [Streptomyces sp. NBC_00820]|uniref:hypothetical protein n=1 Tax=Streptomyces sp. NBC_00820 TaxID=2975842 RepID=UPI002ED393C9|nr:hypothetical protein OIB37_19665 [Streptomyces sp. NBC_00820]